MHGKGKMIWPDGRSYDGEFSEDKRNGQGIMHWPDGSEFNGRWVNGKAQGSIKKQGSECTSRSGPKRLISGITINSH